MNRDAFMDVDFGPPSPRQSWLHQMFKPRVFVVRALDFETAAAWSNCWAFAPYRIEVRA